MNTLAAIAGVVSVAASILLIRAHIRDRKHGAVPGLFEDQPKQYQDWVKGGGRRNMKDLLWPQNTGKPRG